MLDIQLLRTDLAHVARVLATRNYVFPTTEFSALEAERKNLQTYTEELQARRNAASRQIGNAKSRGEDVSSILAEVANLGDELRQAEAQLQKTQAALQQILLQIPNLPHSSVPEGIIEHRRRSGIAGVSDCHQAQRRTFQLDDRRARAPSPRSCAIHAGHTYTGARLY